MPLQVELTPDLKTNKGIYTLRAEDGSKKKTFRFDPLNQKHQKQISQETGMPPEVVLAWFDVAFSGKDVKVFDLPEPEKETKSFYIRNLGQQRIEGECIQTDDLETSVIKELKGLPNSKVIDWSFPEDLCMLDIDYHGKEIKDLISWKEWLETTARVKLKPSPFVFHLSRSNGIHAFYKRIGDFTAKEIAHLAGLIWKTLDATSEIEPKTVARGPGDEKLHIISGIPDVQREAESWLTNDTESVKDEAVISWLEENGLELNHRYPHTKCPIDPAPTHGTDPVIVTESGVFCHRCRSVGMSKSGCREGFIPFSILVGGYNVSILKTLVNNITHWGHAQWVLKAVLGITDSVARDCYSAALKAKHGGTKKEPLLSLVFHPNTLNVCRVDDHWEAISDGFHWPRDMRNILACLPACCTVTEEGEVKPVQSTIDKFREPGMDFTSVGYPPVEVVRGIRMVKQYSNPRRLVAVTPATWYRHHDQNFWPRYVKKPKRMQEEEAKKTIESVLPGGVNWQYLTLLLMARGCNEARVGIPQHILCTGVAKSAKTGHPFLAAGILGDVAREVQYVSDTEKFRSAIREASSAACFVICNEFLKDSMRLNPKMTPEQVMDPLLNFTPDSMSHKLYRGPTKMGHPGVCVWTETRVPQSLRNQTQIARRVHHIDMVHAVPWDEGLTKNRIATIPEIRLLSQDHADACNSILSGVMDEYFEFPQTFAQLADLIGIKPLETSENFDDPKERLEEFFRLVCEFKEDEPGSVNKKRFPGRGYKVIQPGDEGDPLVDSWTSFADGGGNGWFGSRQLQEKDWGAFLGIIDPVHLDVSPDGKRVAIRFRIGPFKNPVYVNEEILKRKNP